MDFKEQKEYIKKVKKIDGHKFNKVTDITNMIDLLNSEVEKSKDDWSGNEIHEISKFLLHTLTSKTILLGKKK